METYMKVRGAVRSSLGQCADNIFHMACMGGCIGLPIGASFGAYEAFAYGVPGIYKLRFAGQRTVQSGALFATILGTGGALICMKNVRV